MSSKFNPSSTVVISGIGMVTSLGDSPDAVWQRVASGECGFRTMPALEQPAPEGHTGAQAVDLPGDFAPNLPREVRYLRFTVLQALARAQLSADAMPYEPERCGIVLGTTLHGIRAGGAYFRSNDVTPLRDFLAGSTLRQATEGLPFRADAATTCSACSSSLGSVALAMTLLDAGELDCVIAGGYDATSEYVYGGFNSLRLVATGPLRPFAQNRLGMKLGEGYGIVILERADAAAARKVEPIARIAGWGESADAHHLTQPHPQGEGAASAIAAALRCADLQPGEIDLVAAHATGTPDNDSAESAALLGTFGDYRVPVVAFKSHLGHTLGGAGAVELILAALALRDQLLPGCCNVDPAEMQYPDLNVQLGPARPTSLRTTLNCSLGFGGANTCVILEKPDVAIRRTGVSPVPAAHGHGQDGHAMLREVQITGIGVVLPGAVGSDAFVEKLRTRATDPPHDAELIPEDQYLHLLNARRVRRMSEYVKYTLAATTLALQDAKLTLPSDSAEPWSAILGTTHGSSKYCHEYYKQVVEEGIAAANPMLFAEGVPNAAAAHLSLMLGIKGACQTIIGTRTAGLDALRLASLRIATGQWDRAIVSAGEEYLDVVARAYGGCGLHNPVGGVPFRDESGCAMGCGAVTLILESSETLRCRNGRSRGIIQRTAAARLASAKQVDQAAGLLNRLGASARTFSSANGTWIDRFERSAIEHSTGVTKTQALHTHWPDLFSVTPLASIAAGLLMGETDDFTVISTGYDATFAAARVRPTMM